MAAKKTAARKKTAPKKSGAKKKTTPKQSGARKTTLAKQPAPKKKPAKASRPATRPKQKAKSAAKRKATDAITIGITPPWLAEDTMANEVYQLFGTKSARPPSEELAAFPWFRQSEAYQVGYYLMTHGLREAADHPEIELCNVPGVFLSAATSLLNFIADYILRGARLADGESMEMPEGNGLLRVIAFREIAPGTGGTEHDAPVLRVLFLC